MCTKAFRKHGFTTTWRGHLIKYYVPHMQQFPKHVLHGVDLLHQTNPARCHGGLQLACLVMFARVFLDINSYKIARKLQAE